MVDRDLIRVTASSSGGAGRRERRLLALAVGLGLLVAAAAARAEPGDGSASAAAQCPSTVGLTISALVAAGKAQARQSQWACARLFFLQAYRQKSSYDVAGNLGIVTHELGLAEHDNELFAEAASHLSAALRDFPVGGHADQRAVLAERLRDARGRVVALRMALRAGPQPRLLLPTA